jgi:hypothetical protein
VKSDYSLDKAALDLDALEGLLAAVPRDPWRHDGVGRIEFLDGAGEHGDYMGGFEGPDPNVGFPGYLAEADLVVAAVNALPALIRRLREAEAKVGFLEAALGIQEARRNKLEDVRSAAATLAAWWTTTYRLAPEKHVADVLIAALAKVGP